MKCKNPSCKRPSLTDSKYCVICSYQLVESYSRPARSKYHVEIRPGVWVDVYDVLHAFGVTNPATAHAIKKMLKPGQRGHKSAEQDIDEAIQSLVRAKELVR